MAGPLAQALRRCQADTFAARPTREPPRAGPVVLLLSGDLQVRGQTAETAGYRRVLVPPVEGRAPIPAAAYNVAAQLLAVEAGVDDNPPTARVHVSDGLWMTARAARLGAVPGPGSERDIAVTLEPSSASERVDMFSRAFGLTPRERELLGHLAGHDTRELARRMFLSENTVQDHLKQSSRRPPRIPGGHCWPSRSGGEAHAAIIRSRRRTPVRSSSVALWTAMKAGPLRWDALLVIEERV